MYVYSALDRFILIFVFLSYFKNIVARDVCLYYV